MISAVEVPTTIVLFGFLIPLITAGLSAVGAGFAGRLLGAGAPVQPPTFTPTQLAPFTRDPFAMTPAERERRELSRQLFARRRVTSPFAPVGEDEFAPRPRRMNVLNPRALNRSIRRVKGFAKFAKRVGSFTDPGKTYRLKGFGRRRRTGAHKH